MNSYRKTSVIVGVLYIAGTTAGIISVVLGPDMNAPDFLASLAANEYPLIMQALFEFAMTVLTVCIPFYLYPILKKFNESLALGHVVARTIETLLHTFGAISLLTLLTLSKNFLLAGTPDGSYFQTLATLLLAVREYGGGVFATIVFSLGTLMLNYILYRSKLIPRWLSVWGLIGATLYLGSGFLPLLGHDPRSTIYLLMEAPLGLWEMFFAVWLIVRGFNTPAITSGSVEHIYTH